MRDMARQFAGRWYLHAVPIFERRRHEAMPKGTVKWFNWARGYGFIQGDSGEDVFIHISTIQRAGLSELRYGQVVECEIVERGRKTAAENLKLPDQSPSQT